MRQFRVAPACAACLCDRRQGAGRDFRLRIGPTAIFIVALALTVVGVPLGTEAQQPGKAWHIGFLGARSRSTPENPDVYYDAFVDGMRELGYVEGKNLVIEWRFADGMYERLPALATELVRLQPDVIVTHSSPATEALK